MRRGAAFESEFDVDGCITEIAARLSTRLPELASNVQLFVEDAIPQMRGDALLMELFRASAESNIDTLLSALRYHIALERVDAPSAAVEHARRLAQHGVPVNALVRSYRLGQGRMNELVFDAVRTTNLPPQAKVAVRKRITATLFQYVDRISQQVIAVYEEEHERWLENQNSIRALRVRELLAAKKAIDVDAATTSIRYPLRWHHLAVVIWYPDSRADEDVLPQLQRFLVELGHAGGAAANPLFVAANRVTGWGWLPYKTPVHDAREKSAKIDKVRALAAGRPDSPSVGIGNFAPGVDGFRRSHQQAQRARSVAIARRQQEPTVLAAADPGLSLAALLAADIDEARDWVADALGDLAGDGENDERLRETLRVFLRCGSSYKLAAEELTLHFNTVRYRVGRAMARRGRPIDADRLDVEVALLLCEWFGTAVLQSPR
ncbi:PucR family transcriptional regulator [Mycobacterium simulans]|uniref:PucR family transcriptional regulator n=1 Tax=Mycobacterium simulans TaxID=627089 RepID=UPI001CD73C56